MAICANMCCRAESAQPAVQLFNFLAVFSNCVWLVVQTLFPLIFTILRLIYANYVINIISYKITQKPNKCPRNDNLLREKVR